MRRTGQSEKNEPGVPDMVFDERLKNPSIDTVRELDSDDFRIIESNVENAEDLNKAKQAIDFFIVNRNHEYKLVWMR